jgi:hypothetical protein
VELGRERTWNMSSWFSCWKVEGSGGKLCHLDSANALKKGLNREIEIENETFKLISPFRWYLNQLH